MIMSVQVRYWGVTVHLKHALENASSAHLPRNSSPEGSLTLHFGALLPVAPMDALPITQHPQTASRIDEDCKSTKFPTS
jgi:hypothetical protein